MDVNELGQHYLVTATEVLRSQKRLADRALEQLEEDDLHEQLDPEANSLAVIIKHLAGNMRSRWRDFLTSDGEKPDRDRDSEFVDDIEDRDDLLRLWEDGWAHVFGALGGLVPEDLHRTVTIRGEPHTVVEAIERQLAHYAHHVGQIVFLAKHLRGGQWKTLSIARGMSQPYVPPRGNRSGGR